MLRNKLLYLIPVVFILFISCGLLDRSQKLLPSVTLTFSPTQAIPSLSMIEVTETIEPPVVPIPEETPTSSAVQPELNDLIVVYSKSGDIWSWSIQRGKIQLTRVGDVYQSRISPDGKIAAFAKQVDEFHSEIWAVNIDGSSERRLVSFYDLDYLGTQVNDPNAVAVAPHRFEWVPGSHTIAFNTRQIYDGPGLTLLDDLYTVDADTQEFRTILPPGQGGEFFIAPDGSRIAISTPTDISLVSPQGLDRVNVLNYDEINTFSEYRYYPKPVWASDSNYLMVAIPPVDPLVRPAMETGLWYIPGDGTQAYQTGGVAAVPFISSEILFSPNLKFILFLRESGEPSQNRSDLMIANSDGSDQQVYHSATLMRLISWSPDSKKFLFKQGESWQAMLGNSNDEPQLFSRNPSGVFDVKWIDELQYILLIENGELFDLVLETIGGDSTLIDSLPAPPADFHFTNSDQ